MMKRFILYLCIVPPIILSLAGSAIAGPRSNGTVEYTFYPCDIDSKRSCSLIAGEVVKRTLAADVADRLEQEARLKELRLARDRAAALITFIVQTQVLKEKWDGTVYVLTARAAGGTEDALQGLRLAREDRHIEQELFLSAMKVDAALEEIGAINRECRAIRLDRVKVIRYYRALDDLQAINGYTKGLILLAGGRYREAVEAITDSIQRDTGGARLHHYRGMAHAKMGNHTQALADFDRAIALDSRYAAPHLGRGDILFMQGHREKALGEIHSAISIDPNFTEAFLLRGIVYGAMGNNRRSIDNFTTAIAQDPELAMAYVYRGNAYGKMGYHRQAFDDYDRAITLDDKLWVAYFYSGTLHERKGTYPTAHDKYSRVIELNPRFATAYANRGRVHSKLGEEQRALEDYDRALELDPALAVAYFNRGLARMKLGQVDRAMDDQKTAARLGWKAAQDFLSSKGIKW